MEPIYHRRGKKPDESLRLRNILNIVFMVLAVVSVVIYLTMPKNTVLFLLCCFSAVIIKGVEVTIRLVANHKNQDND